MQHDTPDDYIVATGTTHSVRELVDAAFAAVGLTPDEYVKHNPAFDRPAEPVQLVGSPAKIERVIGWRAQVAFPDLVREMVEAERAALENAA
jgi:GDPmannose 4,6-dehydratase